MKWIPTLFVATCTFAACTPPSQPSQPVAPQKVETEAPPMATQAIAENYVHLVLALGEHDKDYVDAYYGPASWREQVRHRKPPLASIESEARALFDQLAEVPKPTNDLEGQRLQFLTKQLRALVARTEMLGGKRMAFDDESRTLYDATAPEPTKEELELIRSRLNKLLPGEGSLAKRYEKYMDRMTVPTDRVEKIVRMGLDACRERTVRHIALPTEERFDLELVRGESWGGYNRYLGGYRSLIQVNVDLPMRVGRVIGLGCHEAYPGHHVFNVLIEKNLVRERGWVEMSVYPLFSPQSLIAEGTANYGVDLAFPHAERIAFYRDQLFPAAGIDPAEAERYREVERAIRELGYAKVNVARRYLDGSIDRDAAVEELMHYTLTPRPFAERGVRFFDQYRSYTINYSVGYDLVGMHLESEAGDNSELRWALFAGILKRPTVPSDLRRKR